MKKKVLLVYPEIPTTYWSYRYALEFINKKAPLPPLGLLTVAALLPESYECTIVDLNAEPLRDSHIEEADLVFMSAMMVQQQSFEEVVMRCNRLGKPIVAGGPYPTSSMEKIEGIDHFVLNEAEITLPLFIEDYEKGKAGRVYTSGEKPDMAKSPVPRFDLVDMSKYSTMPLQVSRGCPFNCEFCDIIEMFGHIPRCKNPRQFVNEIEAVYHTGFRGPIFIVDDNFIGNKQHIKNLLREIIPWQKKNGYPFTLSAQTSVNLADDDELLDLMVEAGFIMVFIGIETPVKESLEGMRKNQNIKDNLLESIQKIQRRGIEVSGGFIVGFDSDPENIFELQKDFITESAIPTAMIGLLIALPGTQLYRRLERQNRILGESDGNSTHIFDINFITVSPREKILNGYREILRDLYNPRNYFDRCRRLLERFPKNRGVFPEKISRRISLIELRGLARSFFRQGFSSYGIHYLKFILYALRTNLRFLNRAVCMAVEGYHFFRITDELLHAPSIDDYLEEISTTHCIEGSCSRK